MLISAAPIDNPMSKLIKICLLGWALQTANPAHGQASPAPLSYSLRTRYEHVADDALALPADALSSRLRLGWNQALGHGYSFLLEGEGVLELNDQFNSGANGRTQYPVVADPRTLEVNQAALSWQNSEHQLTLGRQRIALDNQRFIGNVGWRQNEQTFDAVAMQSKLTTDLTLRAGWIGKVQRINGDQARDPLAREQALNLPWFNLSFTHAQQQLVGYVYFLENKDLPNHSTRTHGARWSGAQTLAASTLGWTVELAQQKNHADNSQRFSHRYLFVEPAVSVQGTTLKVGFEQLRGDGLHAFQTPLATLHAFNGWADKFLTTPASGLQDIYLSASTSMRQSTLTVAHHDYSSTQGALDFGREWNVSISLPLGRGWQALAKLASYQSDGFARDTSKIWLQVEWIP